MENLNPNNLREIDRNIASAIVFSSDGKLLMGRKDPSKGGVYSDSWHIPGGGVEPGENLEQAVAREVSQEVVGLDVTKYPTMHLLSVGEGASEKTLDDGEKVWCKMKFNRFEIHLDKSAEQLTRELKPGDDLVELRWFSREELPYAQQIPGGAEFFIEAGYMDAVSS